jgi:hypothetical protein
MVQKLNRNRTADVPLRAVPAPTSAPVPRPTLAPSPSAPALRAPQVEGKDPVREMSHRVRRILASKQTDFKEVTECVKVISRVCAGSLVVADLSDRSWSAPVCASAEAADKGVSQSCAFRQLLRNDAVPALQLPGAARHQSRVLPPPCVMCVAQSFVQARFACLQDCHVLQLWHCAPPAWQQ